MPGTNSGKKRIYTTKPKHVTSGKKHHDDDDTRSQSDYSTVTAASGYPKETYKSPKEARRHEDDDRQDLPTTKTRPQLREVTYRQISEAFRTAELPSLGRSLSAVTYIPIYEYCLLLRRHGISVKLGPDGLGAISQQGPNEPRPVSYSHNCSAHNAPVDIHNPSDQEKQAVSEAITYIVGYCGGEVDMPGFDPQPDLQCKPCSNPIPSPMPSPVPLRRGMDEQNNVHRTTSQNVHSIPSPATSPRMRRNVNEHNNGNRNSLQNGHGSHAGAYQPNIQGDISIGLASDYEDGRSEVKWAQGHGR
ncbi:uncharacterized protein Z520_04383 [Fonsecaea multimorphosa CBS 102226]|uniref:Uncharacterized protein n=1 Tax=Fonsecaea multimorphosa CBS 102226 TaxID=1442371 RepID=A0A0D2K1L0_9EURO|nr:uncharacterized protein Z520_04383 [Fonsecaea multimorphosa CBS 102226]KIX99747.1 hypothetical protein Z520_04383 [Fonsecaea multimorphosa CBS 102226]OAL26537.1 hypothetical protein AYO22_04148 [Fonsecaea multimorphosa]